MPEKTEKNEKCCEVPIYNIAHSEIDTEKPQMYTTKKEQYNIVPSLYHFLSVLSFHEKNTRLKLLSQDPCYIKPHVESFRNSPGKIYIKQ